MRLSRLVCAARVQVAAFDLDGTILSYDGDHTKFGEPIPGIISELKKLQGAGWKIAIWTCRKDTAGVKAALKENGVPFDYVNENPHGPKDGSSKIFATVYVDDRGISFNGKPAGLADRILKFRPWYEE